MMEHSTLEQKVKILVEQMLDDNLFVISVEMLLNTELHIVLDGDQGVKVEDCMAISRQAGRHIEENNWIEQAYRLEVSSFGVGNPLKQHRQYVKNIGRKIGLKTSAETIEGMLKQVENEQITVEVEQKLKGQKKNTIETVVPFTEIKEAKILITF